MHWQLPSPVYHEREKYPHGHYFLSSPFSLALCNILLYFSFMNIATAAVFSPEFTGQRAQIVSHDHAPHLEYSNCQYQTLVACVPLSTKCLPSSVFKFK